MKFVAPEHKKNAFHCPACSVYAHQSWFPGHYLSPPHYPAVAGLNVCLCSHCRKISIWYEEKLVVPAVSRAPLPHPEMPSEVKADFDEARKVFTDSPRSSAALLRLAIQKICIHLGQPGKNLNSDIGELVRQGLPPLVQQSLDIVRVIGNNQVHPGVLDVSDDPETAAMLFELVNTIVEDRISRPKQIEALYNKLPKTAREQIARRDNTTP